MSFALPLENESVLAALLMLHGQGAHPHDQEPGQLPAQHKLPGFRADTWLSTQLFYDLSSTKH